MLVCRRRRSKCSTNRHRRWVARIQIGFGRLPDKCSALRVTSEPREKARDSKGLSDRRANARCARTQPEALCLKPQRRNRSGPLAVVSNPSGRGCGEGEGQDDSVVRTTAARKLRREFAGLLGSVSEHVDSSGSRHASAGGIVAGRVREVAVGRDVTQQWHRASGWVVGVGRRGVRL